MSKKSWDLIFRRVDMNIVKIRDIEFGSGMPKICVPLVEKTRSELLRETYFSLEAPLDLFEWRVDWFENIEDIESLCDMANELRIVLKEIPLLATFRTKKEGGEKEISTEDYVKLNKALIDCGAVDIIDVELYTGDQEVEELVAYAHQKGVKVIMSNHDFFQTPSKEEIIHRLCLMQDKGADMPKIAVMPQTMKDVLTLLEATNEMYEKYAKQPFITMSMSNKGVISRMSGEVFGSCLTFGTARKASAPGQMNALDLKKALVAIHQSL